MNISQNKIQKCFDIVLSVKSYSYTKRSDGKRKNFGLFLMLSENSDKLLQLLSERSIIDNIDSI